jgi:hypothetical protein
MSSVLYYSNFCDNCKSLLQVLGKSSARQAIHFVCIDKRSKDNSGKIHVHLENGHKVLLPPNVSKVPALLLLNQNNEIYFGEKINEFFQSQLMEQLPTLNSSGGRNDTMQEASNSPPASFMNVPDEPSAFTLGGSMTGVLSDNYSFLDTSVEDLQAKGTGGTRQMYNYVTVNGNDQIFTPPDDYIPDKIGEKDGVSMENLLSQRNKEMQMSRY